MIISKLFSFAIILAAQAAFAFPKPPAELPLDYVDAKQADAEITATANFRSIVALSNCSGSLVRYQQSLGSDFAMVMTNGHCLGSSGFLKPGQVVLNREVTRPMNLLGPQGNKIAGLTGVKVLFATMTHTDITLYQLDQNYDELAKTYGAIALTISPLRPTESTSIAVISGYWKRIYSCSIKNFVYSLHEADWTFNDSIKYSQPGCETIGGTSGSPIVNTNTYEVVGINNTGNEEGERCTMDNPCEVNQSGKVTVEKGASYGQQTYWIYGCLNPGRQIDLNLPGCLLKP